MSNDYLRRFEWILRRQERWADKSREKGDYEAYKSWRKAIKDTRKVIKGILSGEIKYDG